MVTRPDATDCAGTVDTVIILKVASEGARKEMPGYVLLLGILPATAPDVVSDKTSVPFCDHSTIPIALFYALLTRA